MAVLVLEVVKMMVVFSEAAALSEAVMVAEPTFSLSVRLSGERVTWKGSGCKFC